MAAKFWTQRETDEMMSLLKEGLSYPGVASRINRSTGSVKNKANQQGYFRGVAGAPIPSNNQPQQLTKETLQAELSLAKRENRKLREALGSQLLLAEAVQAACHEVLPPKIRTLVNGTRRKPSISAIQLVSDWHIGEVVSPQETDGFGEYNYDIANQRVEKWYGKIVSLHQTLKSAYRFEEIVVPVLGDLVQGEIHHDYLVTNEFEPPTQSAKAGYLLAEFISRLSELSPVRVECIMADNHGRLDRKPISKHKGLRNWNVAVYALVETALQRNSRVKITVHPSPKSTTQIAGYRFLLEHGDGYLSHVGYPWYAVGRNKGREAERRMLRPDAGVHYYAMGHWHTPGWVLKNVFVNGSLSGTSEYDHQCGRHSGPSQVEFFVGKHGVFGFTPWDLN